MTPVSARSLAIVAPLPEELSGILKRVENRHEEARGDAVWQVGVLGQRSVLLATTGDGARNAEHRLERLLRATRPDRLILIGIAGALSPDLDVGSVVLARRIVSSPGRVAQPDSRWQPEAATRFVAGTVCSADRIATTPQEKAKLYEEVGGDGPAVVDLESATLAAVAREMEIPCLVLRAVSDRADESLPFDFERFRGQDGSVSRSRIVRYASSHPGAVSALLELRRRVGLCAERLACAVEEVLAPAHERLAGGKKGIRP